MVHLQDRCGTLHQNILIKSITHTTNIDKNLFSNAKLKYEHN